MSARSKRSIVVVLASLVLVFGVDVRPRAQDRFLGKEDIVLLGLGLRVEPDHQVVPRDIATIVSTFLSAPTPPAGQLAPFAPDAIVKGTLRGPGVGTGLELTATPNSPFNIPPLGTAGVYTLEDIRLESGGQILMRGTPESVTIEVIEKLLVTQVTARALSAQEIRDKGIVFDKTSFQAYNFTAAFAVQDTPIQISFPVVLPTLQGAQDVTLSQAGLGSIPVPTLPELKTIIPDTLRLQTQIPNLKVIGFTLTVPSLAGRQLIVPPIPGIVVIPGDIGFLNQFFSVMLLVGNVAPAGSNLVVTDLTGEILLPAGNDTVVGSDDDPLRMAQTTSGPSPKIHLVVQPGADGKLGTADDIASLGPGDSGSAEYLVEGRREGTHVIEFNISGTLQGLPVGPVQVTGRAAGSVLVRNPAFTLTFTHPDTVAAGEHYSLDVTVTNTSDSPANFVSVNLFSQNVSGAAVVGDPSRQVESIPPSDSATVSFELVSRVTGRVTAATLDTEEKVQGRFSLKTAVGELGVPVSPDSLILPSEAKTLPADLRSAVLGLLGKAWAVATAPGAALPRDVARISKQIVLDRAVQAAEAGVRISLHEPVPDSTAQLEMDFIGSDVGRLAALHPDPADLQFTKADFAAFDDLRRRSVRGDVLASAVGAQLAPEIASQGTVAFHQAFAEKMSYRPPHLSVLVTSDAGPLPFTVTLVDAQGRRVGGKDPAGKTLKEIPYSDLLPFVNDTGATTGQMILLAAPDAGEFHLQFAPVAGVPADGPFSVSLVVPDGTGGLRQVAYAGLTGGAGALSPFAGSAPYRVLLDLPALTGGQGQVSPVHDAAIVPPAPHVLGVVQQADKDLLACDTLVGIEGVVELVSAAIPAGRVIAVLFSEEITAIKRPGSRGGRRHHELPGRRQQGGRRRASTGSPCGVPGPARPDRAVRSAPAHRDERGRRSRSRDDDADRTDRDDRHQRRVGRQRPGARRRRRAGSLRQRPAADLESLQRAGRHQLEIGRRTGTFQLGLGAELGAEPDRGGDAGQRRGPLRRLHEPAQRPAPQRQRRLPRPRHAQGPDDRRGRHAAGEHDGQGHQPHRQQLLRHHLGRDGAVHDCARTGRQRLHRSGERRGECEGQRERSHPAVRRVRDAQPDAVQPDRAKDHGQVRQRNRTRASRRRQFPGAGRAGGRVLPERLSARRPVSTRLQRVRHRRGPDRRRRAVRARAYQRRADSAGHVRPARPSSRAARASRFPRTAPSTPTCCSRRGSARSTARSSIAAARRSPARASAAVSASRRPTAADTSC